MGYYSWVGQLNGNSGHQSGQGVGLQLGTVTEFSWWDVGAGTIAGGLGGSVFIRPVPGKGPVTVTHFGDPSPRVMVGGGSLRNRIMAGGIRGDVVTEIVDAGDLITPTGLEWGKGMIGQRIRIR